MSIKILITGVLGFIGRSLAEEIMKRKLNMEIYGIDIKDITEANKQFIDTIHYEHLDVRNEHDVAAYFKRNTFDGIIHLAAISRVVDAENDKSNCIDTNYFGTKYILQNTVKKFPCWFIFGSSREVYGEQKIFPVKEDAEKLPLNIYGFYKLEGERLVQKIAQKYFILRFSNVYGNAYDINDRVVPRFVWQALHDAQLVLEGGKQEIDFTYINDTVDSIIRCIDLLQSDKIIKDELHISPGNRNKITDIIDILKNAGYQVESTVNPPRSYDVEKFIGDPSKRIQVLGNRNFTTLNEGIQKLLKSLNES